MALSIAAAAARARGLGAARCGRVTRWAPGDTLFLIFLQFDDRLNNFRLSRRLGRALHLRLGLALGLFGSGFLGLAVLFGAAALFLALLGARALLTPARFLERCEARALRFAQKLLLKLPSAGDLVLRRRSSGLRRCSGLRSCWSGLRRLGRRLWSFGRRSVARAAEDASLLDLDH